jgi:UDP-N-acetyl-D-mannosaminuronic acid dehydrogenase
MYNNIVKNQYYDLDKFLTYVDLIVIMVKHNEIKENMGKLAGKIIPNCHNFINLHGIYHL